MTISTKLRNISVDTGTIIISDGNYLKDLGGKMDKRIAKFIEVDNGLYHVEWRIADSWNGDISGSGDIQVKSGKIFVGDPCYHFDKGNPQLWINVLKYLENESEEHLLVKTGGDGSFDMNISAILLDAAPPVPIKKNKKVSGER